MYALPCTQLANDAQANPEQTASFLKNIMLISTDPLQELENRTVSGGRLNVFNAMTNLQAYCGTQVGNALNIDNIFPNPSNGEITIQFETPDFEPYQLIISNALGQMVFEREVIPPRFAEPAITENLSWLSPGIYNVTLLRGNSIVSKRLMVN